MSLSLPDDLRFGDLASFCAWAEGQGGVFELVDGRVVDLMTGASRRHNLLVTAVSAAVSAALRASPCRVYSAGQLVRTGRNGRSPDVLVICGQESDERWESDADYLVEVLSPSTTDADLREKLHEYRQLPSIKQYLVMHQTDRTAQMFTPTDLGWHQTEVSGTVAFAGITLDLEAVYDEVDAKLAP